jgi:hypothetical protein
MKLIQSRDNVFFKQLKKLAESGRERRKTGLTLLDGVHLVQAFEAARGLVETLVVAESALETDEISRLTAGRDTVVLADSLMREIGLVDTPSGLLAVVAQPKSRAAVDLENDAVLLEVCRIRAMLARCYARPLPQGSGKCCCRVPVPQPGRRKSCVPGKGLTLCSISSRMPILWLLSAIIAVRLP